MDVKPSEESSPPATKEASLITSLRILSPSFESTQRLSLDKLPVSTTIGDVKNLITPLAPSRPTPDQQRLIYRGRPLLNNSATLQNVLEPPLDAVHTLHLVLPPGPEISNKLHVAPDSGLYYRTAPNRSPNAGVSSYASAANSDATRANRDLTSTTTGFQLPGQSSNLPPLSGLNMPTIQHTVTMGANHPSSEESMRQALEQHRRRADELNMVVDRARALINTHTTRMRIQGVNIPRVDNMGQISHPPSVSAATGANGTNIQTPHSHSLGLHQFPSNGVSQSLILARITSQIMLLELEVERGVAPSIDSIATVRSQLYAMLDARYRQSASAVAGIEIEGLLLRLQHVYMRAYQIRQSEFLRGLSATNSSRVGGAPQASQALQSSEYYIITTPSGEQMILTPPAPSTLSQGEIETIPVFPDVQQVARNDIDAIAVAPNNVLQNVVRQAVLNQQPVRNNNNNNNDQFAQNLRRFWLFMRLYFFCYLFTDSNTWERFLFVGLAAVIAFFSESNITSRLYNILVRPIQRHLEGLIHGEAPGAAQQVNSNNNDSNNNNNQPNQHRTPMGGAQQSLRRIERAFALFIASLIPGLGERQVEVRNAAEEAARNARQQQEQQEQARSDEANANANAQAEGQGTEHENEQAEIIHGEASAQAGESSSHVNTQTQEQ